MRSEEKGLSETINLVWPNDMEYVTGVFTPLGVAYLASYLQKNGFSVKVHDLTFLKQIESDGKKAIYGVSITTPIINLAMDAIKSIKKLNEGNIVVAGNAHATCVPEELIKNEMIDYVVVGEGEETFLELCQVLLENKPVKGVKGIYYKENGKIHFTGIRPLIENLDSIPFPNHELFHLNEYAKNRLINEMGIISSRGCPFNCEFCQPYMKKAFGTKVRYRSAENVVDELEHLKKKYNVNIVVFDDDMVSPWHIKRISKEIISRKLRILWRCQARANFDKETLRIMKKAGCVGIAFGVESGSQKVLDAVGKRLKVGDVERVFKYCREVGIFAHAYIMVGNTSENMEDVFKTLKLLKRIKPFSISISITTPYPGTHLFSRLKMEKKLPEKIDWGLMHHMKDNTFYIPVSNLSKDEVVKAKEMLMNEFKKRNSFSRFLYTLYYMKDIDGLKNVFYFTIKNPRVVFNGIKMLFAISKTGSGLKYTNPKQSFYGKRLEN